MKTFREYLQEASQYTLYWKKIKDKKFNKVVMMQSLDALIKKVNKHKNQLAQDNNIDIGVIELIIAVNEDKVVWQDFGYSDKQLENQPDLKDKINKSIKMAGFKGKI